MGCAMALHGVPLCNHGEYFNRARAGLQNHVQATTHNKCLKMPYIRKWDETKFGSNLIQWIPVESEKVWYRDHDCPH